MLTSLILWILLPFHPIHLSVSEVNYSEKDKSLQMTSRIFIDDLELAIRSAIKDEDLDLLELGKGRTIDQLVGAYLSKHLRMKVDGKPVVMNYLGHELEDLAIIWYIEFPGVKKLKTVEVFSDVIQEIHADQSNLVHVNWKGTVRSARLVREAPSGTFEFETNQKK
ncbi:MAG: DUF6702 family protein [Bacteroidota bacterium]